MEIVVAVAIESHERCEDAYDQSRGIVDAVKHLVRGFKMQAAVGFDDIRCAKAFELGFGDLFKSGGDLGEILIALLVLEHGKQPSREMEYWNRGMLEYWV